MKLKLMFLLSLLFASLSLVAQPGDVLPPPKDVDKEHRKEYRQEIRDWKKENKRQEEWDIVIPPEEEIPVQQYDQLPPASADNWGVRILLPGNLRDRLKAECRYPVVLKIADTGVELGHRDLQSNRLPGTNYTRSANVDDEGGHGTHVYGIAMADGFGLASPLIETGILRGKSVKVLDKNSGSFTWYANAIATERTEDAKFQQEGVSVVYNSSLGGGTSDVSYVEVELKKSTDIGVTFVSAAGNSNGPVNYPGRSKYSITSASLDQNLGRSSFSCFGPEIMGAMPGRNITSTYLGNRYASLSGTSMASPFLAAAAVIAKSKWGPAKLPNYYVTRDYMEAVATDLGEKGFDDYYGAGINYVTAILDTDPDTVTDNPPPPPPPPGDDEPDPEPEPEVTIVTEFDQPIIYRYRTETEQRNGGTGTAGSWHIVTLTHFRSQVSTTIPAAEAYDAMQNQFQDYFFGHGKAMVIPDNEAAINTIRYIPMFFYYFSKNKGVPIYTQEVIGYDEQGRKYVVRLTEEGRGGVPYPGVATLAAYEIELD